MSCPFIISPPNFRSGYVGNFFTLFCLSFDRLSDGPTVSAYVILLSIHHFVHYGVSKFNCLLLCLQYPELMVASYNNNEDAPHEPDGVALVWNMKFKKTTPEYVFHCQVRQLMMIIS